MSEVIISVDLGGTNIRAARLDTDLNILERVQTTTDAESGCATILERIQAQIALVMPTDGSTVKGIGISAPGPINPKTGMLVAPPNLGDCHNVPIVQILQDAFNIPVILGNDANVAALAEAALGAARGYKDVIFITVSTGIGGGIISDGHMIVGKDGMGAEVGHMIMVVNGSVSTLEKESAGPALARKVRARITNGETSVVSSMVNGDLEEITGRIVGDAAKAGDAVALDVVRSSGRIVGLGIASLLHLFNPQIIVMGGGVSKIGDLLFDPMRAGMEEGCIDPSYYADLKIVPAALGDNVSIYGAAALVKTAGHLV